MIVEVSIILLSGFAAGFAMAYILFQRELAMQLLKYM